MLYKRGRYYWLDIRIKGQRIRRSLQISNKLEALSRYAEKKEELIKEFVEGKVRFDDFCKTYLYWAWSSKPTSALHEEQRLEKIKDFFHSIDLVYVSDITPYHLEQIRAYLKTKIKGRGGNVGPSKATINRHLQLLRGMFNRAEDWEVYKGPNPYRAFPGVLQKTVVHIQKRTGIKSFHFHLLRHFFTTSPVERGVDFITISEILGHSNLTTGFVYSHTDKEKKKRAVDLLLK